MNRGAGRGGRTLIVLAAGQAKRYGGVKPLAPVGPVGEAVIDLLASDALAAGIDRVVLVIGPATGPAIRYHVERTWPPSVDVHFALQEAPLGTVDAVLAGLTHVPANEPFGVANADDLYGRSGFELLAAHLAAAAPRNAVVAYRLRHSMVGDQPVTRGICTVGEDGLLRRIDERRHVFPAGGGHFVADDGRQPVDLDGDTLVSMNLWALTPVMRRVLEAAMTGAGGDGGGEVLLPEVVGDLLAGRRKAPDGPLPFEVLAAEGRCIGVTHPGDLALVQADLAAQVSRGDRPAQLWRTVGAGRR